MNNVACPIQPVIPSAARAVEWKYESTPKQAPKHISNVRQLVKHIIDAIEHG